MSVTDYPTWDGKGEDSDDVVFCDVCGRPMGAEEDPATWGQGATRWGPDMVCPHCMEVAAAEGLAQAERQGD